MIGRSIRAGAALVAGVAVGLGPALGTAFAGPPAAVAVQPPTATAAVVAGVGQRALPLGGVANARDVGGYRTIDGRMVKTGLVFRSGDLSKADGAALSYLTDHKLVYDDDLRMSYERALAPDRVPAGARAQVDDVLGQAPPQVVLSAFTASTGLYQAFITTSGADQAFGSVLRDIISVGHRGTVLYHCTAGKDRTGWMTAVLLTTLGVDRGTVNYDFLLSNYYRGAGDNDAANGVVLAALNAAFDQVNQMYGSFGNYVHRALGLSDADIAALKAKMLA